MKWLWKMELISGRLPSKDKAFPSSWSLKLRWGIWAQVLSVSGGGLLSYYDSVMLFNWHQNFCGRLCKYYHVPPPPLIPTLVQIYSPAPPHSHSHPHTHTHTWQNTLQPGITVLSLGEPSGLNAYNILMEQKCIIKQLDVNLLITLTSNPK